MSLTAYRDHCLKMTTAKHRPDCPSIIPELPHLKAVPKVCRGCVTDEDRRWWQILADEATRHLRRGVTSA